MDKQRYEKAFLTAKTIRVEQTDCDGAHEIKYYRLPVVWSKMNAFIDYLYDNSDGTVNITYIETTSGMITSGIIQKIPEHMMKIKEYSVNKTVNDTVRVNNPTEMIALTSTFTKDNGKIVTRNKESDFVYPTVVVISDDVITNFQFESPKDISYYDAIMKHRSNHEERFKANRGDV